MKTLADNYMQSVTGVTTNAPTPMDGDDMTWQTQDKTLNFAEVAKRIMQLERQNERLQNEMAGLAAQVVELRERLDRNEADS